jgi:hypothetical protein
MPSSTTPLMSAGLRARLGNGDQAETLEFSRFGGSA